MTKSEVLLNSGLHVLAIAQARSLAIQADDAQKKMGTNHQIHDVLTFLVLSGLSLELYFKAIMLCGRNGIVTKGHDLNKLHSTFPSFLRNSLASNYQSNSKEICMPVTVIAITQRGEKPSIPSKTNLGKEFDSFENAIESVSNIFTRARYFFEEINNEDYSYIEYPVGQISSLIKSLDGTYNSFVNGDFRRDKRVASQTKTL